MGIRWKLKTPIKTINNMYDNCVWIFLDNFLGNYFKIDPK